MTTEQGFEIVSATLAQAIPHKLGGWILSTKLVAEGYGCQTATIRGHKKDHADELKENEHWFKNEQGHTLWTKRGVTRLGMFVQTPQGKLFRDHAEQLVMDSGCVGNRYAGESSVALPESSVGNRYAEAQGSLSVAVPGDEGALVPEFDLVAEAVALDVTEQLLAQASAEERFKAKVCGLVQAKLDAQLPLIDSSSLGKQLAAQWGLEQIAGLTEKIAMRTGAAKCNG